MKSARRRVEKLERLLLASEGGVEHARLQPVEIEDMGRRLYEGESLDDNELARLKRHGRFFWHQVWAGFIDDQLVVKRLLGVDWNDI
jgi:hypothetical protein